MTGCELEVGVQQERRAALRSGRERQRGVRSFGSILGVLPGPNRRHAATAIAALVVLLSGQPLLAQGPTTITLSAHPATSSEDDGSVSLVIRATLDAAATTTTTLHFMLFPGTNTSEINIPTGSTSGNALAITVNITNDNYYQGDRTFTTRSRMPSGVGYPGNPSLTITETSWVVEDDETASTKVTLSASPASVAESAGTAMITVTGTLDNDPMPGALAVTLDLAADTATAGIDYTDSTPPVLTIPAGSTSGTATLPLAVLQDTIFEEDEMLRVTGTVPADSLFSLVEPVTLTITDDDDSPPPPPPPPLPTLAIDSPSVVEGDSGTAVLTFTVTLSEFSAQPVTVDYADAGSGTATAGVDYAALAPGELTFAVGETSRTIDVTVRGDTLDEADETVVVALSGPTNATIATRTGTGAITDDDDVPALSIDSPSVAEGDRGTAALTFTVALSEASGRRVTVGYADTGSGTATAGADYTALVASALTIAAGETSRTIDVTVTGDREVEADETVVVALIAPANATIATGTGTGAIIDDDDTSPPPPPPPSSLPALSIDSPSVAEGDSGTAVLTFTVALSEASAQPVTVGYADAGSGTATAGVDYAALAPGELTFAAGETSRTIDVTVTGDTVVEGDETVVVALSGPVNATIATDTGTGVITDDDDTSPPPSLPALSIDSPRVAEGDSGTAALTFTVALSEASAQPVTVGYADAGSGTATAGVDYAALAPGELTFAAGETSRTFDVTVTGDTLDERDETVVVALSGPVNATIATGSGTGVITDDDNVPVPALPLAGLLLLALALGWTGWRLTYRHLRAGVSLLLLIAASGTTASAQTAGSFEQLAALLESGDRITVTASGGGERTGRIVDISASALALLIDGERHDFGKEHVDAIHQWRRDDPVLGGLLFGLAIGGGLGALSFSRAYDLSNPGVFLGLFAAAGAGIGAGIDALVPGRRLIYRSTGAGRRVTVAPLLAVDRRGVSVSLGF